MAAQGGNTLTLSGFQAAGGIDGALAHTAERVYADLGPARQRLARDLFQRLTALGEGTEDTKRRISRTELDTADPDTEVVLERLAARRLITVDSDTLDGGLENGGPEAAAQKTLLLGAAARETAVRETAVQRRSAWGRGLTRRRHRAAHA